MSPPLAFATSAIARAQLSVEYVSAHSPQSLLVPEDTLAVFGFGDAAPQRLRRPGCFA